MKKKLMTLRQHRLLKEAGRLIAFSERLKHAQKKRPAETGRSGKRSAAGARKPQTP